MRKEGTAVVVGIAGIAVCGALVVVGGGLVLAGYLAIKGTCLAAKGTFLLGKEAHAALKQHQEAKRQQRLQELEAERTRREEALRAQSQLMQAGIEDVQRRLELSRLTRQAEAAQVAAAAQRRVETLENLRRDTEALASEATLRRHELQAVRAQEARERAQRQEAYLRSLEQEQQKLERLQQELAQQAPPAPEEADRRLAAALVAEATALLQRLPDVPKALQTTLAALNAQQQAEAYPAVMQDAEALIRDLYAHQTRHNLARIGDYTARLQAYTALQQARFVLLTEEYVPTRVVQEWSQQLAAAEALLVQGQYTPARERADQILQAVERYQTGHDVETLRDSKRQAEHALAEARAAVETVTDDEGLVQILGTLQQQSVVVALQQELERLTTAFETGDYAAVSQQCQTLTSHAQALAETAVAHFTQSQRDLIVATAADVLRELGYEGIEHTPVDGFEDSLLLSGFKGDMPFQVTVDLDGTVSVHVGHERFPDQLACSQELDRFFQKMSERGITLRRGELRDTHPARQGELVLTQLEMLEREFEEILLEMGVQDYSKARSAEGVEFTALLGSKECLVNIDNTGQVTDQAGEQTSLDQVREQFQAERQRVVEQQRRAVRRVRGERLG